MTEANLVADLKDSLQDSATVFDAAGDADFKRHIQTAALAMQGKRPRLMEGEITVVAGTAKYAGAVPTDLVSVQASTWGVNQHDGKPWDAPPGVRPRLMLLGGLNGFFVLTPAPNADQVSAWGSTYNFFYVANHVVDDNANGTTIEAADRGLLILRAQAEAMRELMMRNYKKPVAMRGAGQSQSSNMTPSAMYKLYMDEFEQAA